MIRIYLLLLSIFNCVNLSANSNLTDSITVTVRFTKSLGISRLLLKSGVGTIDTLNVVNNLISYRTIINDKESKLQAIYDRKTKFVFSYWLDGSDVSILYDPALREVVQTDGSQTNSHFVQFLKATRKINDKLDSNYLNFPRQQSITEMDSLLAERQSLQNLLTEVSIQDIATNPGSYFSLYNLYLLTNDRRLSHSKSRILFAGFSTQLRNSVLGKDLQSLLDNRIVRNPGDSFPEMTFISADGKAVNTNEQKGKSIYLYFWASWCLPCKPDLEKLQRFANADKSQATTFIFISLDKDIEVWKKVRPVFKGDNGIHVCDGRGWVSSYAQKLGVHQLPSNIIINREGVIVAMDTPASEGLELLSPISANPSQPVTK